jgi:hypothetical protein
LGTPTAVYNFVHTRVLQWDFDEQYWDAAWGGTQFGSVVLDNLDGNLDVYFLGIDPSGTATPVSRVTHTAAAPNDWTTDLNIARTDRGFLLLRGDDCYFMGTPNHYCRYVTALSPSGAAVSGENLWVMHSGYHTMGMQLDVSGTTTYLPFLHDNYPAYTNQAYMATIATPTGGTGSIGPIQTAADQPVDSALDVAATTNNAALVWQHETGTGPQVMVRLFTSRGTAQSNAVALGALGSSGASMMAQVAAGTGVFGVAWVAGSNVKFQAVGAASGSPSGASINVPVTGIIQGMGYARLSRRKTRIRAPRGLRHAPCNPGAA